MKRRITRFVGVSLLLLLFANMFESARARSALQSSASQQSQTRDSSSSPGLKFKKYRVYGDQIGEGEDAARRKLGIGEFNQAASKHKQQLRDLRRTRGVHVALNGIASEETVKRTLRDYSRNTALLFYSFENDMLRAWLIDSTGIRAYSSAQRSRTEIETAIANLRHALRVETLQSSRAPFQSSDHEIREC